MTSSQLFAFRALLRPIIKLIYHWWCSFLVLLRLSSRPTITLHPSPTLLAAADSATGKPKFTDLGTIVKRCESFSGVYTPTLWLTSGNLNTIFGSLAKFDYNHISYSRRLIQVPDGGSLSLDFNPEITGNNPIDDRPILVVLHGLTGGSHSSYLRDVLTKVTSPRGDSPAAGLGWRACVVNFRGCAGTPVTTKKMYHGGYTDDIRCALAFLSHFAPNAPLYGLGFSLGGNVLAKYAGEEGESTPLKAVVIVSCPWHFLQAHVHLSSSWMRLVYSRDMGTNLKRVFTRHRTIFEDDSRIDLEAVLSNPHQTLYEVDSALTRIVAGFPSTEAYYRSAGAHQYISGVSIPLLSLSARDDPVIPASSIPIHATAANPNLAFVTTAHGGHLCWFENLFRPSRWIPKPICEFLREMERADDSTRPHLPTNPKQENGRAPQVGDKMVTLLSNNEIGFRLVGESTVHSADWDDENGMQGL